MLDDLLNDIALLVDFDWINAAVAVFCNRDRRWLFGSNGLRVFKAIAQNSVESDQGWAGQALAVSNGRSTASNRSRPLLFLSAIQ